MYVWLHADLHATQTALHDRVLGVRYMLSDDALGLLRLIVKQPYVDRLIPLIVRTYGVSRPEACRALYTLLGQLDMYGGIRIGGMSLYGRLRPIWTGGFWRVRYPGSPGGLIRSQVHAYGMLAAAGTLLFTVVICITHGIVPLALALLPAAVLATCAVHEAGHALAAYVVGAPYIFLAKPGTAAVLYMRPQHFKERYIALCGPLTAAFVCVAAAYCFHVQLVRYVALATAVVHLYSLLPWVADGKTLWSKL